VKPTMVAAGLVLGLVCGSNANADASIAIGDAITRLQNDGEVIVYTRGIVNPRDHIPLSADGVLDIAEFTRGLRTQHLTLEQDTDGTWFIVRDHSSPATAANIRGRVTDATTGAPLAGVSIEIAGTDTLTDEDGFFELPQPLPHPAEIRANGYQSGILPAAVTRKVLEIPLYPQSAIEEVVVVSSRYSLQRSSGESMQTLDIADITTIPELGDDALRATNYLPGMATVGVSAKPYIRGGLQDELLIRFNNVELLDPFHMKDFQSIFASFNPSLIDAVDVYTGGFPARFGGRMSGVMDIQPALGADDFQAELLLSFLTASASAAGSSQQGRGSWAASARRGNLDWVLDRVDRSSGDPEYSDYYASYRFELTDATELDFGLFAYDDNVLLKDLDDGDGESAESDYRNAYLWTQLHHDWSERNYSSSLISFGSIDHDRDGFINDEDPEEGTSDLNDHRRFRVFTFSHQQHLQLSDALMLELGGRLAYQEGRYNTQANLLRGALGDTAGLPPAEVRSVQTTPQGPSGGIYSSARIRPNDFLTLEFGGRWDFQDYGSNFDQQFSPRFSALVRLREHTRLRLSAGRFYQPEMIHELQAADGISQFQAPQYADHYIVGLDHFVPRFNATLRLEAFCKEVDDPKIRYENLFNPWVLMPEIASDRIALAPEKARARGFELSISGNPDASLRSWFTYSYANAEDRIDGEWQARGWDQEHSVSAGFAWTPGNWTFSAAMLWHSGWRTTSLPDSIESGELPELQRNSTRLPGYFSLDASVARTWHRENQSITLFAEVINLTDHRNIGAYEYDFEATTDGYAISREPFTLLPMVPSIGIRWTFD